jgi:hypothetical protein
MITGGYKVDWYTYGPEPAMQLDWIHHTKTDSVDVNFGLMDFIHNNLDAFCVTMMADFYVGNGTLYNGIKIIENKPNMCLSVAHPRVSQERVGSKEITATTNAELVKFAFEHGHKCLIETEDSRNPNLTWCGLSWRQIGENNFAVVHNLATPFIGQFTESDSEFFRGNVWGQFDRKFLKKLKVEKRIKICGSSDLCFFIEFTPDKHDPVLRPGLVYNDTPHNEEEGNDMFNEMIVNWRRENGRT